MNPRGVKGRAQSDAVRENPPAAADAIELAEHQIYASRACARRALVATVSLPLPWSTPHPASAWPPLPTGDPEELADRLEAEAARLRAEADDLKGKRMTTGRDDQPGHAV